MQQERRDDLALRGEGSSFVPWQRLAHSSRKMARHFVSVMMAAIGVLAIVGVVVGLASSYAILPAENGQLALDTVIHISPGSTSTDIGRLLEEEGMIRDARAFVTLSRVLGLDAHLQAGDYLLSPGMNLLEIVNRLREGRVVTERVTIREGMNLRQIAALLASKGLVDEERFLTLAQNDKLVYGDRCPIDKPIESLEGYLFPDTYIFVRGQSEEDIIKRMVNRFLEVAMPVLESYDGEIPYTPHELVSLASIIEKEAMVDRERPIISAVFHNRLKINMPLQSDPTVQYVMEKPRAKLYYSDLAIDSPYNTYKYKGLPPGPISSPGLASLQAAVNPADVDYLYFVARGDGTHVFSRTFAEHVRARRRVGW